MKWPKAISREGSVSEAERSRFNSGSCPETHISFCCIVLVLPKAFFPSVKVTFSGRCCWQSEDPLLDTQRLWHCCVFCEGEGTEALLSTLLDCRGEKSSRWWRVLGEKHLQGELAKPTVLLMLGWMCSQCWSEDEEKNQCMLYRKDLFSCLQVVHTIGGFKKKKGYRSCLK